MLRYIDSGAKFGHRYGFKYLNILQFLDTDPKLDSAQTGCGSLMRESLFFIYFII